MTPYPDAADRLRELTRLLAADLLRLALPAPPSHTSGPAEPSEFRTNDLAVGGGKSVTVHDG